MKYYAYEDFKRDTNSLLKQVEVFNPSVVVGIARGGLTLAHAMAEGLNIRVVQTLRTELYDGSCKRNALSIFDTCNLQEKKRVLVVDDIADSGETLLAIMNYLESKYPQIQFKSATLYYKTSSLYQPHFWIHEAKEWIDFFWERDFKRV